MGKEFVMGIDVGTTTIRSFIFNRKGEICGSCSDKVTILTPFPGWNEIDPEDLWNKIVKVMRGAITSAGILAESLATIGISCQRATFTTWSKSTGRALHNLITWKDTRADKLVNSWNNGICMRSMRFFGKILFGITRMPRYKAASILILKNGLVNMRLLWCLENIPGLRDLASEGDVMYGGVDSWLLYKLTGNHVTEVSSIAATGMFDPFTMTYAGWVFNLFNIPDNMMPKIVSSCGDHFGVTLPAVLGSPVPIQAVLADQSASVFGSGCYSAGAAKITLGTGSFLDVVCNVPHASMNGLVPLVGWSIAQETMYMAEGQATETAQTIEWGKHCNLFKEYEELNDIAKSVPNSGGVYFVPAFNGLNGSVTDFSCGAGFIGITTATGNSQLVRALLESIVFTQKQLVEAFLSETDYKIEKLVVDGGIAKSDFILQHLANVTDLPVERPATVEQSVWGVALLAGLQAGMWKDRSQINSILQGNIATFIPKKNNTRELSDYQKWLKACKHFSNWNN